MQIGKIPPDILQKQILPFSGAARAEVLIGPKFGEDCAVLEPGEYFLALSSDPITGASSKLGKLAVHISCNDVAATGAEPLGLLLTFLFPPRTTKDLMQALIKEAHGTAKKLNVAILGGHSEITAAVKQVVIVATAVGKVKREHLVQSSGARAGDEVILTKGAGLEGTAILAVDLAPKLKEMLPEEIIKGGEALGELLSVVPEGMIAARFGATAMHDVTEGGVRGALVELATASQVGLEIWRDKIPLAPETKAICRCLNVDPLGLIGSGAMLITAPSGSRVLAEIKKAGIAAAVIGKVIPAPKMYFVSDQGEKEELIAPPRDELYEALEKFK